MQPSAEPAARHDVVDVGVILQRPAPGVQDTEEAEPVGAHELRVRRQGAQRLAGGLEQRGVDHPLMAGPTSRSAAGSVKVTRK